MNADDNQLVAPCGSFFMHQLAARVFWRNEDKDGFGVFTADSDDIPLVSTAKVRASEIHGRRSAIEIDLSCEECDGIHTLIIHNHKGQTRLLWKNG